MRRRVLNSPCFRRVRVEQFGKSEMLCHTYQRLKIAKCTISPTSVPIASAAISSQSQRPPLCISLISAVNPAPTPNSQPSKAEPIRHPSRCRMRFDLNRKKVAHFFPKLRPFRGPFSKCNSYRIRFNMCLYLLFSARLSSSMWHCSSSSIPSRRPSNEKDVKCYPLAFCCKIVRQARR